ncbi:uncharacterized protein LOC130507328 [Raphanus sativus]|uniref:Uncharacterized protein LOC130507328 n=1 Tax=Raphanus sativus TaxID=3726 RepID=A0A9W3D2B9_RAPSA|nr:uncharacterized protein LOC130507328 [Raphanus sativus]
MESNLCFDPGTSPPPLSPDLQKHCENSDLFNSLPDMFVKISSHDVTRFGLEKMKEFCVSKSVFENMISSFKIFKPDELLDHKCFQNDKGINSEIILTFDQFLTHSKCFDHLEETLELDLQPPDFYARKPFDSFVFEGIGFDLSSSRHTLIIDELCGTSYALDGILIKKLLEQKSLETKSETDFCELDFCDFVLQPDILCFETDKTWHLLRSSRDHCVVLSFDDILIYNTFFDKSLKSLINISQSELKLVCSDVEQDMHVLKMSNIVACLEKNLVCNIYFDEHLERLRYVLLVLGKDILMFDLNKYLSCTFDPGLLMFVLSIQEIQVLPLRSESIDRIQQPENWNCNVQTGYLGDASDIGSVQSEYLGIQKVFQLDSNFPRKPTPQGFTEAWNHLQIFTEEGVMNFSNRRFFNPSICEYPAFEADSSLVKKRPEPKPIIGFKMNLSSFQKAQYQEIWPRNHEVMINSPKPVKPALHLLQWEASRSNQLQTRPWRPGDQFTQSVLSQTFLRNVLEAKCSLSSFYSNMVIENKQSCDEVNHLEPVQPSSLVSLSQELKLLEQSASTETKMEASRGGGLNTCVLRTWNWKYLRKASAKLQGSFSPNFSFIKIFMFLEFFLSNLFSFDSGKMDLRTNPFEEGEYDRTKIEHCPAWFMDMAQGGALVVQLDPTEVFSSDYANSLIIYAILDELNTQVSWTNTHPDELSKLVRSSELFRPSNHPRSNTDIQSLFEAYLLNHDVSSLETTWRIS